MPTSSSQKGQEKGHDLTGVVDPAITIGVDLAVDAAQQVICIFQSYATASVGIVGHGIGSDSRWSIFFRPFFNPDRSIWPSLRVSKDSQSRATRLSRSSFDSPGAMIGEKLLLSARHHSREVALYSQQVV